jgi:hypothetical protein
VKKKPPDIDIGPIDIGDPVSIEDGLTSAQRRGLELAAVGWNQTDIAEAIGVTRETVNRWTRLPKWKAALAALVAQQRNEQIGYLNELTLKAMGALEDLLAHGDPHIRLKASVSILNLSGLDKASRAASDAKNVASAGV